MTSRVQSASASKFKESNLASRNFSNAKLHQGLDQANLYASMVQTHLLQSRFQNHVLNSACRGLDRNFTVKRTRSQSATNFNLINKNNTEKQASGRKSSLASNNPEKQLNDNKSIKYATCSLANNFNLIKGVLAYKAEIVPEYSETLRGLCGAGKDIQERIAELKNGINSQKKKISKTSLNCNKLSNEFEAVQKNTAKKEQQNYLLSVQVKQTQTECADLCEAIDNVRKAVEKRREEVEEEKSEVRRVKKFVEETRMEVLWTQKEVGKMKEKVTVCYNSMSNTYMRQNQLKEEKALLITDISAKYNKYS